MFIASVFAGYFFREEKVIIELVQIIICFKIVLKAKITTNN
jgi:hypothetical protein